jgi:hypothetical protein
VEKRKSKKHPNVSLQTPVQNIDHNTVHPSSITQTNYEFGGGISPMPLTKNGYQKIQQDLQTHLHHLLIFFSFLSRGCPTS